MLRNPVIAACITTGYLIIYAAALQFEQYFNLAEYLFYLSPIPLLWLVITVLRDKQFVSHELGEEEEFGYGDKEKTELKTF
jgi:hypothetical protein